MEIAGLCLPLKPQKERSCYIKFLMFLLKDVGKGR
jgi:hypothetical protein